MKRALKWVLFVGGGLVVLVILALIIVPMFVSIDDYKPMIEKKVSEATGRPFRLAGDLDLSLFPWAGFAFSELHLGNPPGFEQEDFVYVKSFDVRVKLLPLISRDVQVKRFVLEGVQVNLEKAGDGRTNWEDLGGPAVDVAEEPPEEAPGRQPAAPVESAGLPVEALAVQEFSVSGAVLWIDHAAGLRKEISDLSLELKNLSLDRPIGLDFSASLDGLPITLEGDMGPLGKDPMTSSIPLDLRLAAAGRLNLNIKGLIEAPATKRRFDVELRMEPFSPRGLLAQVGRKLPLETADPEVLEHVSLDVKVEGDPDTFSLKDGLLKLDDSNLTFSARARDFSRPDLTFALELDRIDLDRYLPPKGQDEDVKEKEAPKPKKPAEKAEPVDYEPLRRLLLDGSIRVGDLKAQGLQVEDIVLNVNAKDGIIRTEPLSAALYQGTIESDAVVDVRGNAPKSRMSARINTIQAGPLVRDLAGKDVIEGSVQGNVQISTLGDQPENIKKNLNGGGELLFRDGAVVGIDIPGMVRNVKSAFTTTKPSGERPRTDFSELSAPFSIRNGVAETPGTELKSPLIRVIATGTADLVNEVLDLRVDPKLVASLKGQDDTEERRGIRVPILVTGTFAEPKFRPDLKGMIEGGLKETLEEGVRDPSKLKDMLEPGTGEDGEEKSQSLEDKGKDLLKGFGIGQ
ncbi:MAG: AsmA family protein [Desulfatiglandales bacterium]